MIRPVLSSLRRLLADRLELKPLSAVDRFGGLAALFQCPDRPRRLHGSPHDMPMYWNCIDDLDGKKSRRQLLEPWQPLLERIVFFQAESREAIARLSLPRVHLAFLDASHTYEDVMSEFRYVERRQLPGDVVVFDDVTPDQFPGVVEAVEEIGKSYAYNVRHIQAARARGYAVAVRKPLEAGRPGDAPACP